MNFPVRLLPVLDGETQVCVAPSGGHRHRRLPVPQRVGDQVREHAIEGGGVQHRLEIRSDGDRHRFRTSTSHRTDQLLDLRSEPNRFRNDLDRREVEPGEIEQLLDQASHPRRLLAKRVPQLEAIRFG